MFNLLYLIIILSFHSPGKTDPYVVLRLGNQVIRSKKNSQTTVVGPPGEPIWNQVDIGGSVSAFLPLDLHTVYLIQNF